MMKLAEKKITKQVLFLAIDYFLMSGRAFSKNSPLPNIPTEHSYRNINKRERKMRRRMKKGFKIIDAVFCRIIFLFHINIETADQPKFSIFDLKQTQENHKFI
jgi:hypothetical protein